MRAIHRLTLHYRNDVNAARSSDANSSGYSHIAKWPPRLEVRSEALDRRVQLRLALAPVVIRRPITDEFLELRELRALRLISDACDVIGQLSVQRGFTIVERTERIDGTLVSGLSRYKSINGNSSFLWSLFS